MRRFARRETRVSFGGRASISSPTQLLNLKLWLRSDLGVTQSGTVSAWADQSGTGDANKNFAQATAANRPTYSASDSNYANCPSISFDGTNDYMTSGTWAAALSTPYTIYIVGNVTKAADHQAFFSDSTKIGGYIVARDNTSSGGGIGTIAIENSTILGSSDGAIVPGTPSVICGVFNGASSAAYVNSATTTYCSGDASTQSLTSGIIGAPWNLTNFLNGKIVEVIVYSGAHDAATRSLVMRYASARYGITLNATQINPIQLPNLQLWLKGSAGVTQVANAVSGWADQSGQAHDYAQGTAANKPTYVASAINSLAAVQFDGSNDYMTGPLLNTIVGSSGLTAYGVLKPITIARNNARGVFCDGIFGDNGDYLGLTMRSTGALQIYEFETGVSDHTAEATGFTTGSYHKCFWRWNGTTMYVSFDSGSESSAPSSAIGTMTNATQVGAVTTASGWGNFELAELVIVNRHSTAYTTGISAYFSARYGI